MEFEVNLRSIVLQQNRMRWAHKEGRRLAFFYFFSFIFRRYRVLWTDFFFLFSFCCFVSFIFRLFYLVSESGSDLWMMWHLQRGWYCWRCLAEKFSLLAMNFRRFTCIEFWRFTASNEENCFRIIFFGWKMCLNWF